ncbi:CGNR zinc finger domain-containing protein [Mycobacterium sp. 1164985.4]|uniref:CGNR zinc finger domain-containing protein n=1 Tax=Mycobacterium sp. 1164985.4 TaxID=1834069 RepID=UPI0007FD4A1A|nr:CGNR zinc finger domain-containing protein [Mycobacterium sp. 1164985.4]OBK73929.1 RNA-binding protein [Mycobacterium sp. 1164985.4]
MTTQWLGDQETKPAPPRLALIQSLVNTAELPSGPDRLADPDDAHPWLREHNLLDVGETVDAADLEALRGVREALRAMLVHNAGGPPPTAEALAPLRSAAGGAARADLDDLGRVRLSAVGTSLQDRMTELLLAIHDAQRDGTWSLLKACANEDCQWAFYDRSRNHGGTWCSMATCGNKLKNREFRARKRASH